QVSEQIGSAHLGQHEIHDDQARTDATFQQVERLLAVVGGQDGIPFAKEERIEPLLRVPVVLHAEDAVAVRHAASTSMIHVPYRMKQIGLRLGIVSEACSLAGAMGATRGDPE